MFWASSTTLSSLDWWGLPAWDGGPTYGTVVEAVRPALRAALLLGWDVDSIDIGVGSLGSPSGWVSLDAAKLELTAQDFADLPSDGVTVGLCVTPVLDLVDSIDDDGAGYAIPLTVPDFVSDEVPRESVPAALVTAVRAFVDQAVSELASTAPNQGESPPRAPGQGLLWLLDPQYWTGANDELARLCSLQVDALARDAESYLLGEFYGPPVLRPSADVWTQVGLSAQAQGQAHRLPHRVRSRLRSMTWLDALSELVARGVIYVDGLLELDEPPDPVTPVETPGAEGDPRVLTLSIWGGDSLITARRARVFDSEGHADLAASFSWDYVPGDALQRPTVVLVAGRGVAIEHPPDVVLVGRTTADLPSRAGARPLPTGLAWDLLIHRVQDDNLVPAPGSVTDPLAVLGPSTVDGDELLGLSPGVEPPRVLVVPKHDGALLRFPARGVSTPTNTALGSVDIPVVVELTIPDPTSGTSAWTADAHFYPYAGTANFSVGGVHLCVWATPDVVIHTNVSPNDSPAAGHPSALSELAWSTAWSFTGELWQAEGARFSRPFSAVLPITESATVPKALASTAFAALPRLQYDGTAATYDGVRLTPARHAYRQFGYQDSVAFDVMDILVSFVPFVGDVADIGEALYMLQTGTDKWGRPVTEYQKAMMLVAAAVPIVNSKMAAAVGDVLARTVSEVAFEDLSRLAKQAHLAAGPSLADIDFLRSVHELSEPEATGRVTTAVNVAAVGLIGYLAVKDLTVAAAATELVDGNPAGWPSVADALSQDGTGFWIPGLELGYLRHRRDHPEVPLAPLDYARLLKPGPPP